MIRVDDSQWPIVVLAFCGDVTIDEVDTTHKQLKGVQTRLGPFMIVSDLTELTASSATARVRQAVAAAADELVERGALSCEAIVVPNAVLRALFTGYS